MRDTVGVVMLAQGNDPADFTEDDFNAAIAELQKQIDSGQIRQVTGNDYIAALETGDVVAAIGWSGDVAALGDPYKFVHPGVRRDAVDRQHARSRRWPGTSNNAERLMDYYYDPAIAAELAAYVQYICPVEGAQEEMAKIDPSLVENPFIFPTRPTSRTSRSSRPSRPRSRPSTTRPSRRSSATDHPTRRSTTMATEAAKQVEDLHLVRLTKTFGDHTRSTTCR